MNPEILDYFSKWFDANRNLIAECHATVDLSEPSFETDKPSRYADVDFDDGELLGRITLWATGECDMEALSPNGNLIFWENYVLGSEKDMDAKLRNLFLSLKKSPEPV